MLSPLTGRCGGVTAAQEAVVTPTRSLTFDELDTMIGRVAGGLAADGVGEGSLAALVLPDPLELLVALLACDRLAATALLVDPGWPGPQRALALESAGVTAVVEGVGADRPGPRPDTAGTPARGDDDTRFLAAFTSGTSGGLRAVVRTRRSWTASFDAFSSLSGIDAGCRVLVPGPLHSTLFLFGAVHALSCGAVLVLAEPTTPLPWGRAHLVPTMLDDLVRQPGLRDGRTVVCAGAPLPPAVHRAAVGRGLGVLEYYGAAELSFVAAGAPGALRPFPGVEVEVRDGFGAPCVGQRGTIWARSAYLSDGYLGAGRGPLVRDEKGFASVSDLGVLSAAGTLTVTGREGGVINTGGSTVVPEEVEAVVRGLAGVSEVAVVGLPHRRLGQVVAAVVEAHGVSVDELRAFAAANLAAAQRPRRWHVVARLPRTSSGKVARAEVLRSLSGEPAPS